ncbi:MAG: B12-binding domain-containing radical SAM protein, partial [Candidatus Omnitrophica bacterium]|nr:B12-binding domain-containing radical SAM protein [Candidatus Omnitrophota bacterium]
MSALTGIRVALIFPSYQKSEDPVSLREAKEHLGVIPPLSLGYVAAILEKEGCVVQLIDASALKLARWQVFELVNKFEPDYLGFTSTTIDFHNTLEWISYLKSKTNLPVIIGGINMAVYPAETLTHEDIDYGVIGEAEETLPELLRCLVNRKDINQVKGICYRRNGDIIINEKRPPLRNIDDTPFPSRHLLSNDRYYSLISKKNNFTAMITSRGCPFHCIFCDNQTIAYRCRSPRNIVDEMEQCKNQYGINEIDIFDALFSVDKSRVIEICKQIQERKLKIDWSFRTRIDLVNEAVLDELKKSGCTRIYYGIESGDPEILRAINKEVDIKLIKRVICLTKNKGIDTFGYFMIGNIGETAKSVKKTLDLMLALPLDYVQISPVFAPPNTKLYAMLMGREKSDYWKEYVLGRAKENLLPRYGTDLTDSEVKKYIRYCYLRFYLR